jgi:hypothetical protein
MNITVILLFILLSLTFQLTHQIMGLIDLSRIRFSDHETMAPSRGWTLCFHTFTVFYKVQPRLVEPLFRSH